jgi:adenylate cyclase
MVKLERWLIPIVFDERVKATVGARDGSIFKAMGDGILAEFASVVEAVDWVAHFQQQRHMAPVRAAGEQLLQLRASIIMADVLVGDDPRFGEGVTGYRLARQPVECRSSSGCANS